MFCSVLINARSLEPKMKSLKKCLCECNADICLITETWLQDIERIKNVLEDYQQKHDWKFLRKDRVTGGSGGGIAIGFNTKKIEMSKAKIPPNKHEIYAAIGRRRGQRRKIAVLVVYIPPSYNAERTRSLYRATNDALMAIQNKYANILLGGRF